MTEPINTESSSNPESGQPILNARLPLPPLVEGASSSPTVEAGQSMQPVSDKPRLEYAIRQHQYLCDFIKIADQKAGFIFALVTGLLALLYKGNFHSMLNCDPRTWQLLELLCFLALLGLLIGGIAAFWVVRPRLRPRKTGGLMFWESVAEYETSDSYIKKVMGLNTESVTEEILDHNYRLSHVCNGKYFSLKVAIYVSGISTLIVFFVIA